MLWLGRRLRRLPSFCRSSKRVHGTAIALSSSAITFLVHNGMINMMGGVVDILHGMFFLVVGRWVEVADQSLPAAIVVGRYSVIVCVISIGDVSIQAIRCTHISLATSLKVRHAPSPSRSLCLCHYHMATALPPFSHGTQKSTISIEHSISPTYNLHHRCIGGS